MAQLSSYTIGYQQIYDRLRSFFLKDSRKEFSSNQERLETYNSILTDLYENISAPSTAYDPYIKGEPPSSAKINKFTESMSKDITYAGSQTDLLSAKIVNSFNLFFNEVENEKRYLDRIASKAKILQMYNQSESEDLVYFGDSFENMDFIDIAKIKKGFTPAVLDGFATFAVNRGDNKSIRSVSISSGNGFIGNNHEIENVNSSEGQSPYSYVGLNNSGLTSMNSIGDSNPLTFFEYEALNVDKGEYSQDDLPSSNEFVYVTTSSYSENIQAGSKIDWSSFDPQNDGPLNLTLTLEINSQSLVNCIEIYPYFKSMDRVTVKSVKVYDNQGIPEEVLDDPIYIGSSFDPLNIETASRFFYNKANIKFSERVSSKIEISFEQDTPKSIDIKHVYWMPNYAEESDEDSPFKDLTRFNPETLTGYQQIVYDSNLLIPKVDNPFQFKQNDSGYVTVPVFLKKEDADVEYYSLSFLEKESGKKFYFYSFEDDNTLVFSDFATYNDVKRYAQLSDMDTDLNLLKTHFQNLEGAEEVESGVWSIPIDLIFTENDPPPALSSAENFVIDIENGIEKELINETITFPAERYNVPLSMQSDILPADRYAIGLRDISVYYEQYDSSMEIVSKPFSIPSNLEMMMVDVDVDIDDDYVDKVQLQYYISVDDGSWIEVSPIKLDYSAVPEVLAFNLNIPQSDRLPGVSYFSYPNVPNPITSVRFKIAAIKDRNINITPVINSYKLIGRVTV